MASRQTPILLRSLARNGTYARRVVFQPRFVIPYSRCNASIPQPSIRTNFRFYSTAPVDDVKVYTFTEVAILYTILTVD